MSWKQFLSLMKYDIRRDLQMSESPYEYQKIVEVTLKKQKWKANEELTGLFKNISLCVSEEKSSAPASTCQRESTALSHTLGAFFLLINYTIQWYMLVFSSSRLLDGHELTSPYKSLHDNYVSNRRVSLTLSGRLVGCCLSSDVSALSGLQVSRLGSAGRWMSAGFGDFIGRGCDRDVKEWGSNPRGSESSSNTDVL